MEAIAALKSAFTPMNFKSFKHLPLGEYTVKSFNVVTTTYGSRVRIEIDDFYMYLPERAALKLNDKLIALLNENTVIMSYMGKDPEVQNRLLLDFEMIGYNKNGEITAKSVWNEKATTEKNSDGASDAVDTDDDIHE